MIPRRLTLIVPAALALAAAAGPSARAADSEAQKRQTVRIEVRREDAEGEFGSGVVLCQKDDLAYVLTAHHVLYGKSQGGRKLSRRDVRTTEIKFYRDLAPAILENRDNGDDRITVFPVPAKDLALMVVSVLAQVPTAAPGRNPIEPEIVAAATGRHPFPVTAVGYAQRSSEGWIERSGALLHHDGGYLLHSAQIEEGFSGGPLFDEAGALVGLNVQFVGGGPTGDDAFGSRQGRTLAIEEVMASIGGWVPAGCVERTAEDTSERDAFDVYKQAVREISLQRWKKAIPLLKDAIDKKPQEGGRVHLQGMRYTEYLPHYQLGLAYYKLDRHREAYREFSISEVHGAIRADKRHRKLAKYKKDAYAKRNEEPAG